MSDTSGIRSDVPQALLDDVEKFLNENFEEAEEYSSASSYSHAPHFRHALKAFQAIAPADCMELRLDNCSSVDEKISRETISEVDDFIENMERSSDSLNFQNTIQRMIAERKLDNASVYKKAYVDKKFFSKIISTKDYVPKKKTVIALALALELPLDEFESVLASAGYALMPSSKFDLVVKYCVIHGIFSLMQIDAILDAYNLDSFASK